MIDNNEGIEGHTVRYSPDESYIKVTCLTCNRLDISCRDFSSAKFLGVIHQFMEGQIVTPLKVIFSWEDFKPNGI
jgi:hypothetical protein